MAGARRVIKSVTYCEFLFSPPFVCSRGLNRDRWRATANGMSNENSCDCLSHSSTWWLIKELQPAAMFLSSTSSFSRVKPISEQSFRWKAFHLPRVTPLSDGLINSWCFICSTARLIVWLMYAVSASTAQSASRRFRWWNPSPQMSNDERFSAFRLLKVLC